MKALAPTKTHPDIVWLADVAMIAKENANF